VLGLDVFPEPFCPQAFFFPGSVFHHVPKIFSIVLLPLILWSPLIGECDTCGLFVRSTARDAPPDPLLAFLLILPAAPVLRFCPRLRRLGLFLRSFEKFLDINAFGTCFFRSFRSPRTNQNFLAWDDSLPLIDDDFSPDLRFPQTFSVEFFFTSPTACRLIKTNHFFPTPSLVTSSSLSEVCCVSPPRTTLQKTVSRGTESPVRLSHPVMVLVNSSCC